MKDKKYNLIPVDFDPFSDGEIEKTIAPIEPQQELWVSCLLGGDDANRAYNQSISLRLTGPLDVSMLDASLQTVVQRHEALRCCFSADGNHICIYPKSLTELQFEDLSIYDIPYRNRYIDEYGKKDAQTAFNLQKPPLFRVILFKLSEEEHLLRLTAHHLICDGWSWGVILDDLSMLYSAYVQGLPPNLPEATSMSQYAGEVTLFSKSEDYKKVEDYWIKQYQDNIPQFELPTDHPRPAARTYKSQRDDYPLDRGFVSQIKNMGASLGCSFVTTLLAAFEVYIHRLTGQTDIVTGLPSAGQAATGNFNLVGHCVNLLPLRGKPNPSFTFLEYLKQRKTETLNDYEHHHLTFGSLLKKLKTKRDSSRVPLVSLVLNVDMGMDSTVSFHNIEHKLISNPREYETFDLCLNATGTEESFILEWSYNTQLFEASTIKRMMSQFEYVLRKLVAHPDILLKDVPLGPVLGQSSNLSILSAKHPVDYSKDIPFIHHISEFAEKTPRQTAVIFNNERISYGELEAKANQLANFLVTNEQVGTGDIIGISMDRSITMVVALLAVLKSGAAYVPLDPSFPAERINFMLEDAAAKLLLTETAYQGVFHTTTKEILVDQLWPTILTYERSRPKAAINGQDLAYILYTSGSTGKPKGVMVEHHSLSNLLFSMAGLFNFSSTDTLLAITTISFDISCIDLYLPLFAGGSFILVDSETARDGRLLLEVLNRNRVTFMQATPATWRMLLNVGWLGNKNLRVISTGEALPKDLAEILLEKGGELWNCYGPTETTVWSTAKKLNSLADAGSIGSPIGNTSVYVLDEFLQPVPRDTPGELYIGGDGVARGYLNRDTLNNEKFVADPFSPAGKMYATGDIGKVLANDEIQCLGRIDSQVKIRGFRIELGEIEYYLSQQPGIKEAVVVAKEDTLGNQSLAAYFTIAKSAFSLGEPADPQEIIEQSKVRLSQVLPYYMIPNDWVNLETFPLTPNNKIDRKALVKSGPSSATVQPAFSGPRTDSEKLAAKIWQESLSINEISIDSDFFELGGHSLLAIDVLTSIEQKTEIKLPLTSLFKNPVLKDFATLLDQGDIIKSPGKSLTSAADSPPSQAVAVIPTIEPQKEIWASCILGGEAANKAYNISFTLYFEGQLNEEAVEHSLRELVRRHEALRATFDSYGSHMHIHSHMPVILRREDISFLTNEEQQRYLTNFLHENAEIPFDLNTGPLFRATLIKQENDLHQLIITAHHIVCDGWSVSVIEEELSVLYSSYCASAMPALAEAPRISEYIQRKHVFYTSPAYKNIEQYWYNKFKDDIPLLDLPIEFPRPKTRSYRSKRSVFIIGSEKLSPFRQLGAKTGSGMAITLLAALEILLYHTTGSEDIIIGLPVAGQLDAPESNRLVGHCVNMLPIRSRVEGGLTFAQYLRSRKDEIIEDYEHQQYTFGSLLRQLGIVRDQSRTSFIPFVFNYEVNGNTDIKYPGLDYRFEMNERQHDYFEIVLNAAETNGGLSVSWTYNTSLFSEASISALQGNLERLLQAVTSEPDTPVSNLQIYSPEELEIRKSKWYSGYVEKATDTTINTLFSEAVEKYPTNIAVYFDGVSISYQDLEAEANRLAHLLIRKGVQPGGHVGLALQRGPELVIAVLAIIKAGAAYMPLDLSFPKERLTSILDNTNVSCILIHQHNNDMYPEDIHVLTIEDARKDMAEMPADVPPVTPTDDPLIYILHTSGSTGQPKGVCLGQQALVNLLLWQKDHSIATEKTNTLQFAPITFDVSFQEIFSTFIIGGTLHLISEEMRFDMLGLLNYMKERDVNRIFLPFVALQALAENAESANCFPTHLTEVMTAGEQLKVTPHIVKFFSKIPDAILYNQYGPTETHVVTQLRLSGEAHLWPGLPTIGKPIYNTRILILNEQLKAVPQGVIGELCVSGKSLAQGYLNLEELTNDKFIHWHGPDHESLRLYRTGDLARILPDGNIEYHGRNDNQIKIRGYRVELGEIEAQLNKNHDVKQAVVTTQSDNLGHKRLIAYLILNDKSNNGQLPGKALNGKEQPHKTTNNTNSDIVEENISGKYKARLKRQLNEVLPKYMIPYEFVALNKLPLTASGKVDRKALPEVTFLAENSISKNHISPDSPSEQLIANIWSQMLGLKNISVHDNFFEIGGYSLIAVKVMLAIEKETNKRLPLSSLFENPTIAKLALSLDNHNESITWNSLVPIKPDGTKPPLYIVHGAGMNVLVFTNLVAHVDDEQPLFGFQARGLDGKTDPSGTVEKIAAEYIDELLQHNPTGPYAISGYSSGGTIAIEMAQQLARMGKEVSFLGLIDAYPHNLPSDYHVVKNKGVKHLANFVLLKAIHMFLFLIRHPKVYLRDRYNYIRGILYDIYKRYFPDSELIETEPEYIKNIQRVHEKALLDYTFSYYDGPLWLFRTKVKTTYFLNYHTNGWDPKLFKKFHVVGIDGEHADIFKPRFRENLAKKIQEELDKINNPSLVTE